jgi:hypothetical protein
MWRNIPYMEHWGSGCVAQEMKKLYQADASGGLPMLRGVTYIYMYTIRIGIRQTTIILTKIYN